MNEIPEYKGWPLSTSINIANGDFEGSLRRFWVWLPLPHNPEVRKRIPSPGYKLLDNPTDASHLSSQLLELEEIILEDGTPQRWAKPEDIERVRKYPVTLAFPLEEEQEEVVKILPMLQYLPYPMMGAYALVSSVDREKQPFFSIYSVSQLPEAAYKRWWHLMEALAALAAPSDWREHIPLHKISANEWEYSVFVSNMQFLLENDEADIREKAKTTLALGEKAYQCVAALRSSWLKQDWQLQWQQIRCMAQELAEDYYTYHQQATQQVMQTEKKLAPDIANVFQRGLAEIYTHLPFQAYPAAAIARKDEWLLEPTTQENKLILSYLRKKPSGSTYVQIREETYEGVVREKVLASMWEQTKKLSELDADVYLAMIAQMLSGTQDEQGNTWISAIQILAYRGIQPKINKTSSNIYIGGQRWEDIEAIEACIKRMKNVYIKIAEQEIIDDSVPSKNKRKRSRKTISRESPLFMFGDTIDHTTQPLDGPSKVVSIVWQYRQSSWMLPFLTGSNRFTGLLFQKVLQYDPYHEHWEKRISRHLVFWLRTNANRKQKPSIVIGSLLEELNLPVEEERPQRTRDHFEEAMNRLASDNLLTWSYRDPCELPPRKWLPMWLQKQILVETPQKLQDTISL